MQEDGSEVLFNCYFPGECFGELPVLDGGLHIATASLQPGTQLSMMPPASVRRLRSERPEFERALTLSVCQTLRMLFSYHFAKMTLSPEHHLISRLADYCSRLKPNTCSEVHIPINQDQFAKQLGISRRTVVDVLNRLENRAQIRREYGAIVVCSIDPNWLTSPFFS